MWAPPWSSEGIGVGEIGEDRQRVVASGRELWRKEEPLYLPRRS